MLARWNPWRDLSDLEREMSDLTRRFFGGGWFEPWTRRINGGAWSPAVDVFAREGDLVVRAELPGVDPEKDIDISLHDGALTIRGERRFEEKTERDNFYRFESSYGSFQRSVPLPQGVKAQDVRATYENGILEVVIPKAGELTSARKIPIAVGSERKSISAKGSKK
ncbi:MAG TPA: Hsp20/alpha crystallin family protein [Actinomycetota bacterium]|jgi:HSP20 family protein